MALGNTVQYTPFQETSFGYGSGQLATNYATEFPNPTDIVKIVIAYDSGNWDNTGHISTPSSGTALAFYNKATNTWAVKGQRDDVDVVLSELKFFPADKPESRPYAEDNPDGFQVKKFKQNTASGQFLNENPPVIGDTLFTVRKYDGNDVPQGSPETITFDPVEPTYDNQRPYWSSIPSSTDYSNADYESENGGYLNFGQLAHGSDTENLKIDGYFMPWTNDGEISLDTDGNIDQNFYSGENYGSVLEISDIYIGDKSNKTETEQGQNLLDNNNDAIFSFTGSLQECQVFLDNLKYKNTNDKKHTFLFGLSVFDGSIGSVITKTMWHQQELQVSTIPIQSFKEDVASKFDLGYVVFSNRSSLVEVNSFKVVITLDSTGQSGAVDFGTTTTVETDTFSNGVLTIQDSNFYTFLDAIRNLEFVPQQDFADNFTFTVQFTFENQTVGSSYTHTAQTINVYAQEASEVVNITRTHTWIEDQVYLFKYKSPLQIIHPVNENFRVDFKFPSLTDYGDIETLSTETYTRTVFQDVITFTGTRDALNDVLEELYYAPSTDFDQSFSLGVTVTRTSGDLTFETPSTGVFTMFAIAQEEYSHTQPAKVTWIEDDDFVNFATGIKIIDNSLDDPLLPAFGSKFKMTLVAKYKDGSSISTDDMVWGCSNTTNVIISGSATITDPMIIIGNKADMNVAINSLKMTPKADFTATQDFYVTYKLERGEPSDDFYALYVNYNKSVLFDKGTPSDEYLVPNIIKFGIERITPLNGYQIVDRAKNKQYELYFTIDNNGEGFLRANNYGNATSNWVESEKRFYIYGSKHDVNRTLLSLEYVPTFNFNTDFRINYYQKQTTDNIIQADGNEYIDMVFDSSLTKYDLDTNNTNFFYAEDLQNQENIISFTKLKNLDGAEEITNDPIHYSITLKLSPTNQIVFDGDYAVEGLFEDSSDLTRVVEERATGITFSGSRAYCNNKILNVVFDSLPDSIGDVDITYTQERFRNNKFDELQANNVTALTIRSAGDVGEVLFSPWDQYFTTNDAITVTGDSPTPRFLQEYLKNSDNLPINEYSGPPIKIIDNAVEPKGLTLYKLDVLSTNILNISGIDWSTKEDFHEKIKDGLIANIDPEEADDILYLGSSLYIKFRVTRKLPSGTETILEDNELKYIYRPVARAYFISETEIEQGFAYAKDTSSHLEINNDVSFQMTDGNANVLQFIKDNNKTWIWGYRKRSSALVDPIEDFSNRIFLEDAIVEKQKFIDNYNDQTTFTNLSSYIVELESSRTTAKDFGLYYNYYNIKPRLGIEKFNAYAKQVFVDSYGLSSTLYITYKQNMKKYSEHMSHDQNQDFSTFGFDTGSASNYGSWTVSSSNPMNKIHSTAVANATLCSHFWVSQDKYAFKFIGATSVTELAKDFPNTVGEISRIERSIKDNHIDKRYIIPPHPINVKLVGDTSKTEIIAPDKDYKSYNFAVTLGNSRYSYKDKDSAPGSMDNWRTINSQLYFSYGGDEFSIIYGEFDHPIGIRLTSEMPRNPQGRLITDPAAIVDTYGQKKWDPYYFWPYNTNLISVKLAVSHLDFRDITPSNDAIGEGSMVLYAAVKGSDSVERRTHSELDHITKSAEGQAMFFKKTAPVIAFMGIFDVSKSTEKENKTQKLDQEYPYTPYNVVDFNNHHKYVDRWFDDSDLHRLVYQYYPQNILSNNQWNTDAYDYYLDFLKNIKWDFSFGHLRAFGDQTTNHNKFAYFPDTILLTRSYVDGDKTVNQYLLLKTNDFGSFNKRYDPRTNSRLGDYPEFTTKQPSFTVISSSKQVVSSVNEKERWARRNQKDNVSRILHQTYVDENNITQDAYLLPTGQYVTKDGIFSFDQRPFKNLSVDLRDKQIDCYLEMPNGDIAYASIDEGKIDDGTGKINIDIINKLSETENYNYLYITKDSLNPNHVYILIAHVDTNETMTGNSDQYRSRLIYLNLEE